MREKDSQLPQLRAGMRLRYVVLHHTGIAEPHYDFMVQVPGRERLMTWRVAVPPEQWPPPLDAIERVADHRAAYMTYEGEISNNRGSVKRVAEGEALIVAAAPALRIRLGGTLAREIQLPA